MSAVKGFKDTIDWYNANAKTYFDVTAVGQPHKNVPVFLSYVSGNRILDAGCGAGHDSHFFGHMGYQVTGIDISDGLLIEARKKYPECAFVQGDLRKLPFKDGVFDGIWSQASLLHMETSEDIIQALQEFHRVLKHKGILYVYVKKQQTEEKTAVVTDSLSYHDRFFQYFTLDEMKELLGKTGFSVVQTDEQEDSHERKEVQWIMIIGKKI